MVRGALRFARRGENDPNWLPWLTMRPPGHQLPAAASASGSDRRESRDSCQTREFRLRNISSSGFCTACRTDLFFSYRRERVTGRMMAAIGIR